MSTMTLCLALIASGANAAPGESPARAGARPATQPADVVANRALPAEEASTHRAELRAAAELYSLDVYRAAIRQSRATAQREVEGEMHNADEKARVLARMRTNLTRRNLLRHPRRRALVVHNHFAHMGAINRQRRQEQAEAGGDLARERKVIRSAEQEIDMLERALKPLAQVAVHARYGQMKSCSTVLGMGLSATPGALMILEESEDTELREAAKAALEDTLTQAIDVLNGAEPAIRAAILTSQHTALRKALSVPAARDLALDVARLWDDTRAQVELTTVQSLAADYWLRAAGGTARERAAGGGVQTAAHMSQQP